MPVIVAIPLAVAVTKPADDTVATDGSDVDQDTLAPDMVLPFWSLTVAESCFVSPIDVKLRLAAESVMEVATGVGVVGVVVGAVPLSPQASTKSTGISRV